MQAKARFLGHPVHQILIVLPLGLLITAVVFDLISLGGNPRWADVAFWLIGAGVIGGLLAAPFGLIAWPAGPAGTPARSRVELSCRPLKATSTTSSGRT